MSNLTEHQDKHTDEKKKLSKYYNMEQKDECYGVHGKIKDVSCYTRMLELQSKDPCLLLLELLVLLLPLLVLPQVLLLLFDLLKSMNDLGLKVRLKMGQI